MFVLKHPLFIESVLLFLEVCKALLCPRNQIQTDIRFNWVQVAISHARVDLSRLISSDHVGSPNHHKNGFFGTRKKKNILSSLVFFFSVNNLTWQWLVTLLSQWSYKIKPHNFDGLIFCRVCIFCPSTHSLKLNTKVTLFFIFALRPAADKNRPAPVLKGLSSSNLTVQ